MRRGIATAAVLTLALLFAPSASAAYEQVGCFAGHFPGLTDSCKPVPEAELKAEGFKFSEEVQLGGVGGMAVNYTGAGGVEPGTVYAATRVSGALRVAMFTPETTPASELTFSLSWEITNLGGAYGRCGPALGSTCPPQVGVAPQRVDVDIDPTTGNVYVSESVRLTPADKKYIMVYTPDGSEEITRFGERIEGGKTADTAEKLHSFPPAGAIAVNGAGEVYVFDVNNFDNFYHRLMVFKPKVPGKYDAYEYAGATNDIGAAFGAAGQPEKPVLDAAGNIYVSSQESSIEMYDPAAGPSDPPVCRFDFPKEGIAGITVDPKSATPFFYSYKKETGFALRTVRQLAPCDPASGKFKDPVSGKEVIDLINVSPERDYLWGLAFDPVRKLAGRPAGVLYGAAPSPVPNIGTGQTGQSSLGYVFAQSAVPQKTLTVTKSGSGTGKVTSSPSGIDCGSACTAEFGEGEAVTLTAKADGGSEFKGFSGACTGTAPCEVTMSEAKEVTASFEEEEVEEPGIPLTVALEGTGIGTVSSDKGAISCNPFCSDEYEAATVVVLTATPTPGSIFYSWRYCDKGGVNGRQCTVSVDKAKTVKATFTTTHALTLTKAGGLGKVQSSPGGVLCLFNCSETAASFREGTEVTLKPTPAKHFHFVQWGGDCSGSGACEVTMGEDHDVSAEFAEDPKHLLTLTKTGGGAGTVKSSVAGINCGVVCSTMSSAYYQGEVVELTATPGKGSAFKGWSGAGCSGTGTCSVTISEAKAVTAEFG